MSGAVECHLDRAMTTLRAAAPSSSCGAVPRGPRSIYGLAACLEGGNSTQMSRTALGLAGVAIGIGIGVTACGGSGAAGHDVGPKDGVDSGAPADHAGSNTGSGF